MAIVDLLQRFRPAGAPGGAGPVAVPAREDRGPAMELAPVFEALGPVIAECDALRAAARDAADAQAARAQREAAATIAEATSRAPAERAAVAARIRRSGDATADAVLREAQLAAERLRSASEARMTQLVSQVIANLRASITADATPRRSDP